MKNRVAQIDGLIRDGVDGILIWPMQEAPTGPPVDRAAKKGIPTVSVDRLVGSRKGSRQDNGEFSSQWSPAGALFSPSASQRDGEGGGKYCVNSKTSR